ncbi:MAG: SusC/RagA family TonB-linked outer membrane protein, partial [Mangrovibacterium sp.]
MRITVTIFLLGVSQVMAFSSYSQNIRLSLNHSNTTIRKVLEDIEDKTDFYFMYNSEFVDVERNVSIQVSERTISDVLNILFAHTGIQFKIEDRQIALTENTYNLRTLQPRQFITVTGIITGTGGNPVPGATIVVKGTTNGTISSADGSFILRNVPGNAIMVVSFVGMKTREVEVANQQVIKIVLEEETIGLEEVVAIGYGVQRKKLTTGSTIQVKGDIITRQSTVSPMTALQGQTPGVSIIKSTGEPGAGFKVNIRGMGTIGNSEPLIVIDGVPGGSLDYLNPTDIESVDVLKDAASAAIYGSRAANGVILVTTKRGANSGKKANINYDGYYGWQNLYKKLPLCNAQEYALLLSEARVNSEQSPLDFAGLVPDWDKIESGTWKGTDWLDELVVDDAPMQNHSLTIFGNTDISNYSMGMTFTRQEGIMGASVASKYDRYNFHLNTDYELIKNATNTFDILKVGESIRYSFTDKRGIGTGNQYWNDIFSASVASPFLPMYATEEDDEAYPYHYAIPWNMQEANPIASMIYNRGQNKTKTHNLDANLYLEIQPIQNLILKSSFGYRYSSNSYRSYTPEYSLSSTSFKSPDEVSQNMDTGHNWSWENTISYSFKFREDHSFYVLA